jgi:hypothetical protein
MGYHPQDFTRYSFRRLAAQLAAGLAVILVLELWRWLAR